MLPQLNKSIMSENKTVIKLLDEIIKGEGFIKHELKINKVASSGSFLGEPSTIEINGVLEDGEKKKLNLFMKTAPKEGPLRGDVLEYCNRAYENEIFAYTKLKKYYTKLQDDFEVPSEERYEFAKYYNATNEEYLETIILENLIVRGYGNVDRQIPASLNFMNAAIESLAKFQALSFATEKMYPDFFENEIKSRKESTFTTFMAAPPPGFFPEIQTKVINTVKNEIHRSKFRDWLKSEQFYRMPETLFQPKRKVCALRHGDYKVDNIMANFDEKGKLKKPALIVDYQFMNYGPPLIDLIFIITSATDANARSEYFDSWTELYYITLKNFLKYFSLDIEDVYPRENFELDLKELLPVGLFIASIWFSLMFMDPNDKEFSLDNHDKSFLNGFNVVFEQRLNAIVKDYVDWGYL